VKLPPLSFVVLDTETTGFIPRVNRVIEFAAVRVDNGKIVSEYEQLFSIPTEVPQTVQVLTRIRPEILEGKPSFEEMRDDISDVIDEGTLIIGQNVGFDIRMLRGEGLDLSDHPWIDTSMLASLVFPELASYSLGYVSNILKLKHEPVHRALGDVNATLELLSKCWGRLLELTPELSEVTKTIMEKSSPGYKLLFSALPEPKAKKQPKWLKVPSLRLSAKVHVTPLAQTIFEKPEEDFISLVEEPLAPTTLQQLLDSAVADEKTVHWVAVKNLETALRRLTIPKGVRVLHPPENLLDLHSAIQLAGQESFTADEGSLALKLAWYEPETIRDMRVHGEERSVWNGKLTCTNVSDNYTKQFEDLPSVILLDHRQLLSFLADPSHRAHGALDERAHIIVDDASMLEDTASKALGWHCVLDAIRAGAEGNKELTSFTDVLQIWIEKAREGQDVHELHRALLETPEVSGLQDRLKEVLAGEVSPAIRKQLEDLGNILDAEKLSQRVSWIEERQDGAQHMHSVPEFVNEALQKHLYSTFPTTLLIPKGSAETLTEIIPRFQKTTFKPGEETELDHIPIAFNEKDISAILKKPPGDRTVVLLPSRRLIEDYFISQTEKLEKKGITLICQNLSGGLERLQAEFTAAPTPCVWLLTPWTYEGVTLPPEMVDHLILQSLPFDHPKNFVFSKRSEHYQNSFIEYSLPRLEHRLFRILRTFCRHRTEGAGVTILDKRISEKKYGERVKSYLNSFARKKAQPKVKPKRKRKPKKTAEVMSEDQLTLF